MIEPFFAPGVRLGARRIGVVALAAVLSLFVTVRGAGAIVLNDGAAANAGGIANYFDSANAFPNVVELYFQPPPGSNSGSICTGTLINSRTILTAAHCVTAKDNVTNTVQLGSSVYFSPTGLNGPGGVAITGAVRAPGYNGSNNDLALVSLTTPVTNLPFVTLLQPGAPVPGFGATVTEVGFGSSGTGTTGNPNNDDKRRVGQTELGAFADSGGQLFFQAQFRNPLSPGAPDAFGLNAAGIPTLPLEAGVAPGDSGGPLFWTNASGQVIEISEVQGGSGGNPSNGYGETNLWTPVQLFTAFMAQNNPLRQETAIAGNFNWSNAAAWQDSVAGVAGTVPNDTVGTISGFLSVAKYYNVSLANPGTVTLDISPTVNSLSVGGALAVLSVPTAATLTTVVSATLSAGTVSIAGGTLVAPGFGITGGLLTGAGTVTLGGGAAGICGIGLCNTGGIVGPTGALTIGGNYAQGAGGIFAPRAGAVSAGGLNVTGAASLAGALQVTLVGQGKPIASGAQFTVLTAANLSGVFAGAPTSQLSPFISDTATYTATNVNLTLTRNASYASAATTDNAVNFARSLDKGLAAGTLTPDMLGLLGRLDAGSASDAQSFYSQAAADGDGDGNSDVVGNQLAANMAAARVVDDAIDAHLAALRDGAPGDAQRNAGSHGLSGTFASRGGLGLASASDATPGIGGSGVAAGGGEPTPIWLQGIGAWQTLREDDNAFGVKQAMSGLIGGVDLDPLGQLLPGLKGGLAFSYLRGALGGGSETGATDSYRVALYWTRGLGPFYADGRAGYGHTQMSTSRNIDVGDFDLARTATASTGGDEWTAALDGGYRYTAGVWLLEPSVGLAFDRVGRNGYTESGAGALDLSVNGSTFDSLRASAGLRAQASVDLGGGYVAWPELRARYIHETLTPFPVTIATLQGDPDDPFEVDGVNTGSQAAQFGVGVTVAKSGSLAVFAGYDADLRRHQTVNAVVGGLRVSW